MTDFLDKHNEARDRNISVSVVVISYNHAAYVTQCLDSIRQQDHVVVEVIAIDDASTDATPTILTNYSNAHPGFMTLRLNDANVGLTKNLNIAVSLAKSEYVTYISADDYMLADRLYLQLNLMRASEAELSYTDALVVDSDSHVLYERSSIEFPWPPEPFRSHSLQAELLRQNWIPAASIIVKADELRAIGCYDESIFFEDYELLTRAAAHGWAFSYIPEPLVAVRRLDTSLSASRFMPDAPPFLLALRKALTNFENADASTAALAWGKRWEIAKRMAELQVERRLKLQLLRSERNGARSILTAWYHYARVLIGG